MRCVRRVRRTSSRGLIDCVGLVVLRGIGDQGVRRTRLGLHHRQGASRDNPAHISPRAWRDGGSGINIVVPLAKEEFSYRQLSTNLLEEHYFVSSVTTRYLSLTSLGVISSYYTQDHLMVTTNMGDDNVDEDNDKRYVGGEEEVLGFHTPTLRHHSFFFL